MSEGRTLSANEFNAAQQFLRWRADWGLRHSYIFRHSGGLKPLKFQVAIYSMRYMSFMVLTDPICMDKRLA
jgi:hypothetical protein